jgi:hypothetical protein
MPQVEPDSASGGPGSANLLIGDLQNAIQENGAPRVPHTETCATGLHFYEK